MKRILIAAAVAILLSPPVLQAESDQPMARAMQAERSGNLESAVELYGQIIEGGSQGMQRRSRL